MVDRLNSQEAHTLNSKAFAEWLSQQRKASEYPTQEALARASGCEKAYISKLESPPAGVSPQPSLKFLADLSRALRVSMVEPLRAMGYVKQADASTEPHVVRLLHYYRQLPPDDQKLAEELVRTLVKERGRKEHTPVAAKPKRKTA